MSRRIIFVALVLSITTILAGCSSDSNSKPTQSQLQAFASPPPATPAQRAAGLQAQEANILKLHPELASQNKNAPPPPSQ